ncbi:MAG: amidohydrolase [Lachnospiraceae bacterium]|nr:amidohydrolase [Lachnospiraceae bacterium]
MNYRFYNGRIMTMDPERAVLDRITYIEDSDTELWVKDNNIYFIGNPQEVEEKDRLVFGREINLEGNLLMPSFKNAHAHSAMTFLRSFADDLPLDAWLNTSIFPMEAKLKAEDVYWLSQLAFLEYTAGGIGACLDMYFFPEMMAKSAVDFGMRMVMNGTVNNFKESVDLLEEYYNTYNNYASLVGYRLGFHAEYTTSQKIMEGVAALSEKYKAPVYTHSCETRKEVEGCIERYGVPPVELMKQLELLNHGGAIFHGVHLTEAEMDLLKENNITVVTNPASNAKLASGIADLKTLYEKGINIALGTDGPASNNALDMFREMYLAAVLQKLRYSQADAFLAERLLSIATVNGAKAMGLNDCDYLAKGKLADLIVIDLKQPNMQPHNNIARNIVYSGNPRDVKITMIDGKILYEDGKFTMGEERINEIYRKCNEIIDNMK